MRVWCATVLDPDQGEVLFWDTCHSRALESAREFIRSRKDDLDADREPPYICGATPHEIPTDRVGLVAWLNSHVTHHNG
jgi:hypothetical protein